MWYLWRRRSRRHLALVQFFVTLLTITSSIAVRTETMTGMDAEEGLSETVTKMWQGSEDEVMEVVHGKPDILTKFEGSGTVPLLSLGEHQRNASSDSSSSGGGRRLLQVEGSEAEALGFVGDYKINQRFGPQHANPAHRTEFPLTPNNDKHQQHHSGQVVMSSMEVYGRKVQGNDSMNLPWSVLCNASDAICQPSAHQKQVPDASASSGSVSGSRTSRYYVNITRINSVHSKEEDSSKVIESISGRRLIDEDSNRDNVDVFGSSNDHPHSTDESGASLTTIKRWTRMSRRRDIHDHPVRNNRTTSSSSSTADAEETADSPLLTPVQLTEDNKERVGAGEDAQTVAAVKADGDSQADQSARGNAISEDTGTSRGEVRRPNNGTTNALLAVTTTTTSPQNQNERTLVHNKITRAAPPSTTTVAGLISRDRRQEGEGFEGEEEVDSISEARTTMPSSVPVSQHRQSAVLVGSGPRNKSATSHNSIRALNYISDRKPYIGKHHHNNDKHGPHFEDIKTVGNVTNMTVQMGQSIYLNCRISLLQDKTVSWMRRLVGENELQLLTVGNNTYSGDPRYAVHYQYPHNWRLKITKTQVADEGTYVCQLSTHPPRVIQYNLHINAPQVMIIDEVGVPLQDKYYEVDSTIQLSCIVRDVKMRTSVVYWNHSDQILNFDITRGGISVKTDLMGDGANSTLLVARVNKTDTGNYSCSISPDQFYTVTVHVLNGESYAELHHGNGTTIHRGWPSCVLWVYGLLLGLLHVLINPNDDRHFNRR